MNLRVNPGQQDIKYWCRAMHVIYMSTKGIILSNGLNKLSMSLAFLIAEELYGAALHHHTNSSSDCVYCNQQTEWMIPMCNVSPLHYGIIIVLK